ncbi:NADH-quinone oxidoreductase subunit E [Sphingomonas crocodyli]|uniref:NADH-quinone oxidoreductase subunit E n=1 Tax=Sphingomonas crocodyli TaxID=1979270 RepID=A0A437LUY6_9SPHN|nr:NAD(P)H-dependent oxidoreductase subunit E [Sphingomonas crocodyli]RVT89245.1 NADH-quinone oxidoreductase subunit E [Sphingomonas crocodyli]
MVGTLADRFAGERGALLPLLHAIQAEVGWVPDAAIPLVARALNLSRAEVHGVVTFYHDFRREPAGRHIVKLCLAEACKARGVGAIETALSDRLGLPIDETSEDGRVSFEAVYCLGLCATGPNALVNDKPVSRLDAHKIDRIVAQVSA